MAGQVGVIGKTPSTGGACKRPSSGEIARASQRDPSDLGGTEGDAKAFMVVGPFKDGIALGVHDDPWVDVGGGEGEK